MTVSRGSGEASIADSGKMAWGAAGPLSAGALTMFDLSLVLLALLGWWPWLLGLLL